MRKVLLSFVRDPIVYFFWPRHSIVRNHSPFRYFVLILMASSGGRNQRFEFPSPDSADRLALQRGAGQRIEQARFEGPSDTRRNINPCRLKTDFDIGSIQWENHEHKVSAIKQDSVELVDSRQSERAGERRQCQWCDSAATQMRSTQSRVTRCGNSLVLLLKLLLVRVHELSVNPLVSTSTSVNLLWVTVSELKRLEWS